MFDIEEALRLVPKQTVLCIGDVMLEKTRPEMRRSYMIAINMV
jgi:hypothetical protein